MPTKLIPAEIDEHTSKLIVGLIALYLAGATSYFADKPLQSISASYHEGGWSRDIFVGFLFAIAAFLFSYNGKPPCQICQMIMSKVGALAAIGVAMFPCECKIHDEVIPNLHGLSAAVMFIILATFCYFFFMRAWAKSHPHAILRATIYALCGLTIVLAIIVIGFDKAMDGLISTKIPRLVFYGEAAGLAAFGIAWLTASRILPLLTHPDERLPLFAAHTEKNKYG